MFRCHECNKLLNTEDVVNGKHGIAFEYAKNGEFFSSFNCDCGAFLITDECDCGWTGEIEILNPADRIDRNNCLERLYSRKSWNFN